MSRVFNRIAALGQSAPGNQDAVDALVRAATGDSRHAVRDAACFSLQNVAAAVPGLIARLRSAQPRTRAGAAEALVSVGKPAAIRARSDLLDLPGTEPEVVVRRKIARAVGSLILAEDVTRWIDPLARALRDPDMEVRDTIAGSLYHAGRSAARLTEELADCLRIDHESLRRKALQVLGRTGLDAGAALPAVIDLIRLPSIGVQLQALQAAWAINGDRPPCFGEVLDALERLSSDPVNNARSWAMHQLGEIAAGLASDRPERDRAIALLWAGQSDRHADVREAASQALQGIDGESENPSPHEDSWDR
jgi:HEAT repeat protein